MTDVAIREVTAKDLLIDDGATHFVNARTDEIQGAAGDRFVINALSGGVDSSVVTVLGHRALGDRLLTFFIDNGLMREGEPESVIQTFGDLDINVELIDAREQFFNALRGLEDPEDKRNAITQTFYHDVFGALAQRQDIHLLLQGTILTDVDETVAGIKRQHNVLAQMGIDTEAVYGYTVIEPLIQLRKDGVRIVGKSLGLPDSIFARPPFPGPALAARIYGEVTPEEVALVRRATKILEDTLSDIEMFQCMAILHKDTPTGMRDNQRQLGRQIEIRCWESVDARTALPLDLAHPRQLQLARSITSAIPEVVSVTYNITPKPVSTMEAV